MYRDLFINLTIIISFLTVLGQLFKYKAMYLSRRNEVVGGLLTGLLGIILMYFSIKVTDTTILDLRNFAIIVATVYGGIISSIISGFIIAFGRVFMFGINASSIMAVIIIILLVVLGTFLSKGKLSSFKKFYIMSLGNIVAVSLAFIYLIDDQEQLVIVLIDYGLLSLLGGFVIYNIWEFIARSNENYRLLKESAQRDFLTGLNNVRQFDRIWNAHLLNAKEKNERLSLLFIDIDYFKKINDTYGHAVGDLVLKELGRILQESIRSFDTVSRNGGEEFSVILPDCPNHQAIEIAEKIRVAVEKNRFMISETETIKMTISIGVSTFPETTKDTDLMIEQADASLYRAKNLGRNKVCSTH